MQCHEWEGEGLEVVVVGCTHPVSRRSQLVPCRSVGAQQQLCEHGFVWAGPVVVFAVAIDGGLNGWGYSPAAVSTSPTTRSCFPVSLPPPPVHSSRCSRPLAWPSRWPWLSSGCPFDRALGVRSLGPKNRNRAIVAQFRGAPFKKAAGSGLGECWSEVGEVRVRLRVSV